MYVVVVAGLMCVLPIACTVGELVLGNAPFSLVVVGKWFVLWSIIITSRVAADPPAYAMSVREVRFSETLLERLFFRNDLRDGHDDHEQRRNEPGTYRAEPHRPSDQQQQQSQIHWIAADPKNTIRHQTRSLPWLQGIESRPSPTEARACGHGDRATDYNWKRREIVPRGGNHVTER